MFVLQVQGSCERCGARGDTSLCVVVAGLSNVTACLDCVSRKKGCRFPGFNIHEPNLSSPTSLAIKDKVGKANWPTQSALARRPSSADTARARTLETARTVFDIANQATPLRDQPTTPESRTPEAHGLADGTEEEEESAGEESTGRPPLLFRFRNPTPPPQRPVIPVVRLPFAKPPRVHPLAGISSWTTPSGGRISRARELTLSSTPNTWPPVPPPTTTTTTTRSQRKEERRAERRQRRADARRAEDRLQRANAHAENERRNAEGSTSGAGGSGTRWEDAVEYGTVTPAFQIDRTDVADGAGADELDHPTIATLDDLPMDVDVPELEPKRESSEEANEVEGLLAKSSEEDEVDELMDEL